MNDIECVYIQTKPGTPHPLNENVYLVWYGCEQMGIETRMFETFPEIEHEITRKTPVAGGIGNVRAALDKLGCPFPPILDVPDELIQYFGRVISKSTLGDIRNNYEVGPFFVKPLNVQKAFDGHLIGPEFRTLIKTANRPDEMEVWVSEVVNFVSEYRLMVHHNEIVASRHYKGDFTISPDYNVAKEAIYAFKSSSPIAYSLDVGVLDTGRTVIVEVNDSFSLGAYGTPPLTYTNMVLDRWFEMVKNDNKETV